MVLRRYAWQIGGVATAAAVVAVLVTLSLRGSGTGTHAGATPTIRASASATADPRVEQVKAIARAFVEADVQSGRTGDPTPVDALTAPGSQAEGNAATTADFSRQAHHALVAARIDFDESAWRVSLSPSHALVSVSYTVVGHEAEWPSLRPLENDHPSKVFQDRLAMELTGQRWLIDTIN